MFEEENEKDTRIFITDDIFLFLMKKGKNNIMLYINLIYYYNDFIILNNYSISSYNLF